MSYPFLDPPAAMPSRRVGGLEIYKDDVPGWRVPPCLSRFVLYPYFEEKFYLPALFADGGDGGYDPEELIGQKHHSFLCLWVPSHNPAEP